MRVLCCLIMALMMLPISAFAEEVWVVDLDSSPVVLMDDGSVETYDEPAAEDPVTEDPVTEDPVPEDPAIEDPVADDPVIENPAVAPEDVPEVEPEDYEWFTGSYASSYEEEYLQEPEVISLMSYAVADLNDPETAVVSDPEDMTMRDVVVMVLGEYSPRTQTVTQYISDGSSETYTEIVPGVAGMDWAWISGAGLFGLVLFSFFKFVGVLLKNG